MEKTIKTSNNSIKESNDKNHWYIAIVPVRHERRIDKILKGMGYESYVASQMEMKVLANKKKKEVERIVISSRIFIRVSETERLKLLKTNIVKRFVTDKACVPDRLGRHPVAVVPDKQMEMLQFMLFNADSAVTFSNMPVHKGSPVKVIRGCMKGLEGLANEDSEGKTRIHIQLDICSNASVIIDTDSIEPINKQ